jgi:hypothetical protein
VITLAEAGKLGAVRTASPGVLSLYLAVPVDPAELRGLPTRADDLIAAADADGHRRAVREVSIVRITPDFVLHLRG